MMKRILLVLSVVSTFALASTSSANPTDDSVRYRMARYTFGLVNNGNESQPTDVEWAYPIFLARDAARTRKLNEWVRQLSLEALIPGAEQLPKALKLLDRQVIELLKSNPDVAAFGTSRVIVNPARSLGHIQSFEMNFESMGSTRPQHAVSIHYFSYQRGLPVSVESLFKPEAAESLSELLQTEIEAASPSCTSRSFRWQYVSVGGPSDVFLSFPYAPAASQECGDGTYRVHGPAVRALLKNPAELLPVRRIMEVQLKTPNPSIERTAHGEPWAAAHVKR